MNAKQRKAMFAKTHQVCNDCAFSSSNKKDQERHKKFNSNHFVHDYPLDREAILKKKAHELGMKSRAMHTQRLSEN